MKKKEIEDFERHRKIIKKAFKDVRERVKKLKVK